MSKRVLIVEDERAIAEAVSYALAEDGFEVETRSDGEAGLEAARSGDFDLLILDLKLPKRGGIEVCRRLRTESVLPIIMLTAKDAEIDRIVGLEIGADDYVTKPFSIAELVSRVRALLRRQELDRAASGEITQRVGGLVLDRVRHRVGVDDREVRLTASEFKILSCLISEPERVFTRREIMERLWDSSYVGDQRACDVHVANVRRKIERDPARPERLLTVRGVGYKLVPA